MVIYLQFEEYLLRKILLLLILNYKRILKSLEEYYYTEMYDYLSQYGIEFSQKSIDTMEIILDKNKYYSNFKKEKILRRK